MKNWKKKIDYQQFLREQSKKPFIRRFYTKVAKYSCSIKEFPLWDNNFWNLHFSMMTHSVHASWKLMNFFCTGIFLWFLISLFLCGCRIWSRSCYSSDVRTNLRRKLWERLKSAESEFTRYRARRDTPPTHGPIIIYRSLGDTALPPFSLLLSSKNMTRSFSIWECFGC